MGMQKNDCFAYEDYSIIFTMLSKLNEFYIDNSLLRDMDGEEINEFEKGPVKI